MKQDSAAGMFSGRAKQKIKSNSKESLALLESQITTTEG